MFEEKTFNVPELATRWNKTPRQILEHAASMKLGLLFDFDGLVIDARGDRLVQYDAGQKREHENLTAFVYGAEDKFKRRIAGLLRQGETLTTPEAIDLRKEVMTAQAKIKTLEDVFDVVTRERIKYHYRGYLRATPETVNDLLRQGFAVHPNIAHRLDGTIVRLDVGKAQWQERLEPTDMLVMLDEVKAIEAAVGKAAPAKAKARNGRPKMIDKKANAVRQIVELFEKTAAIQFEPNHLPGSAADLLDACQRMEKAKTKKVEVFSTSLGAFNAWLKVAGYRFSSGRTPKTSNKYWTQLCVKTIGLITPEVFT